MLSASSATQEALGQDLKLLLQMENDKLKMRDKDKILKASKMKLQHNEEWKVDHSYLVAGSLKSVFRSDFVMMYIETISLSFVEKR
jgi:hypothetical protein